MNFNPASIEKTTLLDARNAEVDPLTHFAKRKILLIGLPILFGLGASMTAINLPDIYEANTKILPRDQSQTGTAAVLNQLNSMTKTLSIRVPIDPNLKLSNELYVGMLKSRSVAMGLIERFDLKKVYGESSAEQTQRTLASNTNVKIGKDGIINLTVEDRDPKRAAAIANGYVDELLKLAKSLAMTNASQKRAFYERQLKTARERLAESSSSDKSAAKGETAVHGQSRLLKLAGSHAQRAVDEIKLIATQSFVARDQAFPGNRELMNQDDTETRTQSHTTMSSVMHDTAYYKTLVTLLQKQVDVARADEAADTSLVQVVDEAVEPETRSKPNAPCMY